MLTQSTLHAIIKERVVVAMASTPSSSAASSATLVEKGKVESERRPPLGLQKSQQTNVQERDTVDKQNNQGNPHDGRSEIETAAVKGADANIDDKGTQKEAAGGSQDVALGNQQQPASDRPRATPPNVEVIDLVDSDDSSFDEVPLVKLKNSMQVTESEHLSPEQEARARPTREETVVEFVHESLAETRQESPPIDLSKVPAKENLVNCYDECDSKRGKMASEAAKMPADSGADDKNDSGQSEVEDGSKSPQKTKRLSEGGPQSDPSYADNGGMSSDKLSERKGDEMNSHSEEMSSEAAKMPAKRSEKSDSEQSGIKDCRKSYLKNDEPIEGDPQSDQSSDKVSGRKGDEINNDSANDHHKSGYDSDSDISLDFTESGLCGLKYNPGYFSDDAELGRRLSKLSDANIRKVTSRGEFVPSENEDQESETNSSKKQLPENVKASPNDDELSESDHSTVEDRKLSPDESKQAHDDDDDDTFTLLKRPVRAPRGGPRPTGSVWDPFRREFVPKRSVRQGNASPISADGRQSNPSADKNIDSPSKSNTWRKRKGDSSIQGDEDTKRVRRPRGRKDLSKEDSVISPSSDSGQEESTRKRLKTTDKNNETSSRDSSTSKKSKASADNLSVGDRVCYEWEDTKEFYSATILAVKKKQHSRFYQYTLYFDDGDFKEDAPKNKVKTLTECRKKCSSLPRPMPHEHSIILEQIQNDPNFLQSFPPNTYTLRELYLRKCFKCVLCKKRDCGACASCQRNETAPDHEREVCIQKMCCADKVNEKLQPMPPSSRFPPGWNFVIDPTMVGYSKERAERFPRRVAVNGLKIFSPSNKRSYYSVEAAISQMPLPLADVSPDEFYKYIGALPGLSKKQSRKKSANRGKDRTTTKNFLVGRTFSIPWMNLNGQRKIVHGRVVKYVPPSTKACASYKVVYGEESRINANLMKNGCGSVVPASQILTSSVAIGACVRHEEERSVPQGKRLVDNPELPFYVSYTIPDSRNEEFVKDENGAYLPRLTLVVRGFRLTLCVKPSRIPDAGNGVFLSCKPMFDCGGDNSDDEVESFVLAPGELVDLGIYGPLQMSDRKPEAALFVKNFIHSRTCEEWAFEYDNNSKKEVVDITDETTGNVHDIAKKTVLPYVNECNEDDRVNINAQHDPENSVHYFLGHANETQGSLGVPCDGTEIEVYVHYDDHYERVRVRKGYSFLPEEERGPILEELIDEDITDVKEINEFDAADVQNAVNYLFNLFTMQDESKFAEDVIERALLCSAVLHRRAKNLLRTSLNDESSKSLEKQLRESSSLVGLLLRKTKDTGDELKLLHSNGNVDGFMQRILRLQYSPKQLAKLGDMME